jgi:zinc transporter, ZIP family
MPFGQLLVLGAVAGFTIYLGLPFAAFRNLSARTAGVLTGIATGILLFLTIDVLSKVLDMGKGVVTGWAAGHAADAGGVLIIVLLVAGTVAGLLGIPLIERGIIKPLVARAQGREAGRTPAAAGASPRPAAAPAMSPTALSLSIAAGIGLHNLGEGLAIGQAAMSGAVPLAFALVIGFGLHNMTEGFGIASPLANARPSAGFVFLAGLIGGGPTFLGTLLGASWTSPAATALFLSLAGGSLAYVTPELLSHGGKSVKRIPLMASVAAGFFAGYATDLLAGILSGA